MSDDIFKKHYFYFNNMLCSNKSEGRYYKTFGKNWSLIGLFDIDNQKIFKFLNWFENGYLTITNVSYKRKEGCTKTENVIKMDGDIIDGFGTDNLPMFSFGTPLFNLNNKNYIYEGIGCGHIKIMTTKKYKNQKLIKFMDDVRKELTQKYGKKYIEHTRYFYLMYFFKYTIKNDFTHEMKISDSYLYYDTNPKTYKFNINFPMGLFIKNGSLYLTCGIGDYYNTIFNFDVKKVIKNCKHDIVTFDALKYDYKLKKYTSK